MTPKKRICKVAHEYVTALWCHQNSNYYILRRSKFDLEVAFLHMKGTVVSIHDMKVYKGRRGIAPLILNLGVRCEWSTMPWPLYRRERIPVPIEYEAGWASELI